MSVIKGICNLYIYLLPFTVTKTNDPHQTTTQYNDFATIAPTITIADIANTITIIVD